MRLAVVEDPEETHVDSVSDLLDAYLICRTLGHSWDDDSTADYQTIFSWTAALRCTRCTTRKIEAFNNLGDVIYRRYDYPLGYRVLGSFQGGRLTRSQVRSELMRRRVLLRRRPGRPHKMPTKGRKLVRR